MIVSAHVRFKSRFYDRPSPNCFLNCASKSATVGGKEIHHFYGRECQTPLRFLGSFPLTAQDHMIPQM